MVAPAPRDLNVGDLLASAQALDGPPGGLDDLLAALLANRPAFHADALCQEYAGKVNWFPATGEDLQPAKQVCARCLVKAECRSWALAQPASLEGVWGGTSKQQRRQMRAAAHGMDSSTAVA